MANNNSGVKKLSVPSLLEKKSGGCVWTEEEIKFLVNSVVNGTCSQGQLGALCTNVYHKSMTKDETVTLTSEFVHSGETFIGKWPEEWRHLVVDKHSTGGVGDKVSLPLAPALAASGLKVPMISGRGLGHTGGTLDKLESIPGFTVEQSSTKMRELVENIGACIVGQTSNLCPADKHFYACRDETSTVNCNPLIVASIVSKKAVEGISSLVLDVKFGSAAFMKTQKLAEILGQEMANVGEGLGIKTTVVLTTMDNPIGRAIGNSLEIKESLRCLNDEGPEDLEELVVEQGAHLLRMSGLASSTDEGKKTMKEKLRDGSALQKFKEMMIAQGVKKEDAEMLCEKDGDVHRVLKRARCVTPIPSPASGYVHQINAMDLALVCLHHGAGRLKKGDVLNNAVGLELAVGVGDQIEKGETWAEFHHEKDMSDNDLEVLKSAITVKPEKTNRPCRVTQVIHAK